MSFTLALRNTNRFSDCAGPGLVLSLWNVKKFLWKFVSTGLIINDPKRSCIYRKTTSLRECSTARPRGGCSYATSYATFFVIRVVSGGRSAPLNTGHKIFKPQPFKTPPPSSNRVRLLINRISKVDNLIIQFVTDNSSRTLSGGKSPIEQNVHRTQCSKSLYLLLRHNLFVLPPIS